MNEKELFFLLQFSGGTFPSGGFSQSWGLETYVSQGRMRTEEEFKEFLAVYLDSVIGNSEGPVVSEAYQLTAMGKKEELFQLDELLTAMKLTKESREAGLRMGKAFLRIAAAALQDEQVTLFYQNYGKNGINYAVAYGAICARVGVGQKQTLTSYVFSSVNAIIQSAVKLIPLGNSQAQKILLDMQEPMLQAVERSLALPVKEVTNFCPGFDIAGIVHETLPVRLYMS